MLLWEIVAVNSYLSPRRANLVAASKDAGAINLLIRRRVVVVAGIQVLGDFLNIIVIPPKS